MRIAAATSLVLTALVGSVASQAPAPAVANAAAVIAVEREFAADGATRGWAASFRRYHAPDAIVLQPDPIKAEITLAKVDGDGPNALLWTPSRRNWKAASIVQELRRPILEPPGCIV